MPRVIASWSSVDVFSKTENGVDRRVDAAAFQLAICERCSGVRPRRSGGFASCRRCRHARDLGTGRRNLASAPHNGSPVTSASLNRNRIAAARVVDFAQPFHDERHQRRRFAGLQRNVNT